MDKSVVLIGLPGSGKTTVGSLLAARLRVCFADSDRIIEFMAGMSIPEIFANQGEATFRGFEREVILGLSKTRRLVIATGGGVVLNDGNMKNLAQNGVIVHIQRPHDAILESCDILSRPLWNGNRDTALQNFVEREPLYTRYRHFGVWNTATPKRAVDDIMGILHEHFSN